MVHFVILCGRKILTLKEKRGRQMGVFKKERKMKVHAQTANNYKYTSAIILKGDWLGELGFEPGNSILVECEGGRLVITKLDEMIM